LDRDVPLRGALQRQRHQRRADRLVRLRYRGEHHQRQQLHGRLRCDQRRADDRVTAMAKLFNRAKVNTATVGTGTITLGAAVSAAFCTFAEAGVANGDKVTYIIEDGTNFEIGVGTYTSAGTTLSRDTVRLSKISGVAGTSKISLSGAAIVYIAPSK